MTKYIHNQEIIIQWAPYKNIWLKNERGIDFIEIEQIIRTGDLIDIVDHPNQIKYPDQKQFIVRINNYLYIVPFVKTKYPDTIFLKTIYTSRKITKEYKQKGYI